MNISKFSKCANCGACYNICPCEAINVNENGLFYTPEINNEKCIDCGLCVNVCPVNKYIEGNNPIIAYAGWHKNSQVVLSSSSGGIFYGLSKDILAKKGIVYGAAYSEDNKEVIFMSTDIVGLKALQKSKYVESKVASIFKEIKFSLNKNRAVLFCGTPCQVAGLKNFLGKEYDNLLICDFVCGGLPSHQLYIDYLNSLEERYKSKIEKIDFRPKTHGWKRYAVKVEFKNGKKYNVLGVEDPYLRCFLHGKYSVRDYCLECKFSCNHMSDITIADFWMHETITNLKNENGISLIVCNTKKGVEAINKLKKDYYLEKLNLQEALYNHKEINTPQCQKERHDRFLQESIKKDMFSAFDEIFDDNVITKLKYRIIRKIKKRKGF